MSPFEFEAFPRFTVDDRGRRDRAFRIDTRTCSGRDLVEEFLVCGVRLLSRGWTIGVVARINLDGFDRQIFSSTFTVDLGDCSYELFVAETEMEAEDLVGRVTEAKLEKGAALRCGYDRVNRVFILMGLEYEEHKAKPKRGSRTSTGVPAQSQTSTETPSVCSKEVNAAVASEAFVVNLATMSKPPRSLDNAGVQAAEDFVEQVTRVS
ncbi:hypothetical protein Zm00014a_037915 [Zea mays]|uniref:Uncharacterized protein n=1 Tax=Zea mays TaxID=4577 RepID=A0A3L6DPL4_MAIZE|nr:hypothetical protein Zm00014a_037915 [Zea mays]